MAHYDGLEGWHAEAQPAKNENDRRRKLRVLNVQIKDAEELLARLVAQRKELLRAKEGEDA